MNKNLIYMVSVNHDSSRFSDSSFSQYSIQSWQAYCDKNDIDFICVTEHDKRLGKPIWNQMKVFEYGKGYDKIGVVDSDTMIKWNAPNPFDNVDGNFCAVNDLANFQWINKSVENYKEFFPDVDIDYEYYFNSGVTFFDKKYLAVYEEMFNFYLENQKELDAWDKGGGRTQTILNYLIRKNKIQTKMLKPYWNLLAIHKKDMFKYNWQLNEDQTPYFIKYGYIWHFTGFALEQRESIMKQTWDFVKKFY